MVALVQAPGTYKPYSPDKVCFPGFAEFGLFAAESAFGFDDLHAFTGSRADEVGFDYVDKSQKSRAGMVCGMAPVGRWGWTLVGVGRGACVAAVAVDGVFRLLVKVSQELFEAGDGALSNAAVIGGDLHGQPHHGLRGRVVIRVADGTDRRGQALQCDGLGEPDRRLLLNPFRELTPK